MHLASPALVALTRWWSPCPATSAWSTLAAKGNAPPARYSHACAVNGSSVFVFGGTEGGGDFVDLDDLHVLALGWSVS